MIFPVSSNIRSSVNDIGIRSPIYVKHIKKEKKKRKKELKYNSFETRETISVLSTVRALLFC